ncbi:hypothetical protein SUDANB6_01262 [Streptomyces sp. enrichment culture]|uniref:hypothetical protein n=1 Tax=Streptomyces sp. enrichment culture TaxID=1795815 RepID=UPI003F56047D
MSEQTVPQRDGAAARPKGLLERMEELMAALDADLSALDADLQSAARKGRVPEGDGTGAPAGPA